MGNIKYKDKCKDILFVLLVALVVMVRFGRMELDEKNSKQDW